MFGNLFNKFLLLSGFLLSGLLEIISPPPPQLINYPMLGGIGFNIPVVTVTKSCLHIINITDKLWSDFRPWGCHPLYLFSYFSYCLPTSYRSTYIPKVFKPLLYLSDSCMFSQVEHWEILNKICNHTIANYVRTYCDNEFH